jgi:hypothetical protein
MKDCCLTWTETFDVPNELLFFFAKKDDEAVTVSKDALLKVAPDDCTSSFELAGVTVNVSSSPCFEDTTCTPSSPQAVGSTTSRFTIARLAALIDSLLTARLWLLPALSGNETSTAARDDDSVDADAIAVAVDEVEVDMVATADIAKLSNAAKLVVYLILSFFSGFSSVCRFDSGLEEDELATNAILLVPLF